MEMDMENARNKEQQLNDVIHEHQPSVFCKDVIYDQNKAINCSFCRHQLSGRSYRCDNCAGELSQIDRHPLHNNCQRELSLYAPVKRPCEVCRNPIDDVKSYGCPFCSLSMHTNCALESLINGFHLKRDFHPHQLLLIPNLKYEPQRCFCHLCAEPILDSCMYVCVDHRCRTRFHEKCAQVPTEITHPCHRNHILLLSHRADFSTACDLCGGYNPSYFYSCSSSCDIWFHPKCILDPSFVIEDRKRHQHSFNLFWRHHPFICDACGLEGKYTSYVCVSCHIIVHKKCISSPRFIKHARHPHPISHKYYCAKPEQFNRDCRFCYQDVKTEHGSYTCMKQDCDYIVHEYCVTYDSPPNSYNEINEDEARKLIESGEFLSESCITCVIKKNELGEALEIKHSFHEHSLLFQEKVRQEEEDYDEKQCDGCVEPISTSFYYCSPCNFFLHKSCAELPVKMYHWSSLYPLTLKSEGIFYCDAVDQHDCSGFYYYYNGYDTKIRTCLRCAMIGDTIVHPGHNHFLFYNLIYDGQCKACHGKTHFGVYRCKDCDYAVHPTCVTLPYTARHKFDKHVMKLSYHDEDDPTRNYCDICEEKRDPKLWFYHCTICDNTAHPKCILGEYSWIKTRSKYKDEDFHPHPLTFIRKVYLYSKYHLCGDPCDDLAAECDTCINFIVHRKCIKNFKYSGRLD